MEHKIDEAAVWQRVAGSASRSANESPRPVTIAPVLREIWEEMECCHRLFFQLARSGSRGYAPIQQAQRQQTGQLGALICSREIRLLHPMELRPPAPECSS